MSGLPRTYQRFQSQYHELWEAYDRLGATATEAGPLERKCRELIKLGMAAARQSESGVKSHPYCALEARLLRMKISKQYYWELLPSVSRP